MFCLEVKIPLNMPTSHIRLHDLNAQLWLLPQACLLSHTLVRNGDGLPNQNPTTHVGELD